MKLAICGKGGCGKSTIVALLSESFNNRGYKVLVIDSDESNSGLYKKLGFNKSPLPIINIVGGRHGMKKRRLKQTQIYNLQIDIDYFDNKVLHIEDIPTEYIVYRKNIHFTVIGKINQAFEGCACPMGVLNRELLTKLKTGPGEVVLVDTEAGLEHFGRGMESGIDGLIIVIEPSAESMDYAEKVHKIANFINPNNIWVILNKVQSKNIAERIRKKLKQRKIDLHGYVGYNKSILMADIEGKSIVSNNLSVLLNDFTDFLIANFMENKVCV